MQYKHGMYIKISSELITVSPFLHKKRKPQIIKILM